jgi:hypothetical protein
MKEIVVLVKTTYAFVLSSSSLCIQKFCVRIGGCGIVECLGFIIASQSQ